MEAMNILLTAILWFIYILFLLEGELGGREVQKYKGKIKLSSSYFTKCALIGLFRLLELSRSSY